MKKAKYYHGKPPPVGATVIITKLDREDAYYSSREYIIGCKVKIIRNTGGLKVEFLSKPKLFYIGKVTTLLLNFPGFSCKLVKL